MLVLAAGLLLPTALATPAYALSLGSPTVTVARFVPQHTLFNELEAFTGDRGSYSSDLAGANVDVAQGTTSRTETSTDQPVDVPFTTNVGSLVNGEQVQVIVSAVETSPSGVQDAVATRTGTLTCTLDASGNGTCS
ncbi:hypothetical protein [Streptomyces barringtoniae]|uniref:hypothetical protein n=1 Tax=Streptomyces barringtoniae TaxID=2892029 RepID=UPI001E5F0F15|nr:hypothetical protein [Streptomyces barringtoniae]MCC5480495.1 hypothetical protein [Streptomyces barringtoniae]